MNSVSMKIFAWGTRGSVPVANRDIAVYGGNTTCFEVLSSCLPEGMKLVIDAGSGFVPFGYNTLKEGIKKTIILFTHYHHDHTQGLFLAPLIFIKSIPIICYGPIDNGVGPLKMIEEMMRPPYFPVDSALVASHISDKGFEHPPCFVIVIHPKGGNKVIKIDELENLEKTRDPQVTMGVHKYHLGECLIIKMFKCNHPESTISYRFEERTTGKVFVFLTDHENQDGIPQNLIAHLKDADLLVVDAQYTREDYDKRTAGFGHGTADYCVRLAKKSGVRSINLTHHNPGYSDTVVGSILEDARVHAVKIDYDGSIFSCADYQMIEVM